MRLLDQSELELSRGALVALKGVEGGSSMASEMEVPLMFSPE